MFIESEAQASLKANGRSWLRGDIPRGSSSNCTSQFAHHWLGVCRLSGRAKIWQLVRLQSTVHCNNIHMGLHVLPFHLYDYIA